MRAGRDELRGRIRTFTQAAVRHVAEQGVSGLTGPAYNPPLPG